MKQLTKAAILAVGTALVTQAAQAGDFVANDLYLGFNSPSAASDYIIDLGPGSTFLNATTAQNLGGDISMSMFNSVFTSGSTGVNMAVVGGDVQFQQQTLFLTQLRTGTAFGTLPGSPDLSGYPHNGTSLGLAAGSISAMSPNLPAAGNGLLTPAGDKTYSINIAPTLSAQSLYGETGVNPLGAINGSGVVTEDLWYADVNNAYRYVGFFSLNLSGANPSLTFTSVQAVPEPGSLSLLAGAGLLFLAFRRRLARRHV